MSLLNGKSLKTLPTSEASILRGSALAFCGSFVCYAFGIWVALVREYQDWTPDFDIVIFAVVISLIPFVLPLFLNIVAVLLLLNPRRRTLGIGLLIASCILAFNVAFFVAPMGNF